MRTIQSKIPKIQLEEWIDRLKSGTIPQGKGALCTKTGEKCCIAVFCDIAGIPYNIANSDRMNVLGEVDIVEDNKIAYNKFEEVTGLEIILFTPLNDGGLSFLEIGRWISQNIIPAEGLEKWELYYHGYDGKENIK